MLARRFTIVCLMTALFGMGFASLVAQSQHSRLDRQQATRCALTQTFGC